MKPKEMTTFERGRIIDVLPNYKKCSDMYGFSISPIWKFKTTGNVEHLPRTGRPPLQPKIVKDIQTEGESLRKIAEKYDMSKSTVENYAIKFSAI